MVSDREGIILVGGGGHAKVIIELVAAGARYRVVGVVDNVKTGGVLGVPVLGRDEVLPSLPHSGITRAFVAIGDNRQRLAVGRRLQTLGFEIVNTVSPAATVSGSAKLGVGIAIMPGAVVNADCRVEDFAIINTGAIVDHDGEIGEASHVGPGCVLAGTVTIGRLAFLGTGTSVIPGISVGEGAVVGAGACLIRDVPPNVLAVGIPARVLKRTVSEHENKG
jgi:UDP-perosamine 4-acetyltransferase